MYDECVLRAHSSDVKYLPYKPSNTTLLGGYCRPARMHPQVECPYAAVAVLKVISSLCLKKSSHLLTVCDFVKP